MSTTTTAVSPLPETTSHYRRLASGLIVPKTQGQRTFVAERLKFPGFFDSCWESYGTDKPSQAQPETLADVYEQTKNGEILDLLTSFHKDPTKLIWTQDQALAFIESHPDWFKNPDPSVLFPLEGSFVARVRRLGVKLRAIVRRFDFRGVWNAEYRFRLVLPQRTV